MPDKESDCIDRAFGTDIYQTLHHVQTGSIDTRWEQAGVKFNNAALLLDADPAQWPSLIMPHNDVIPIAITILLIAIVILLAIGFHY